MKARDIIPGWPKGRSTSVFSFGRADLQWMRFLNLGRELSLADLEENIRYHEAQQEMVDRYFEYWRTKGRSHKLMSTRGIVFFD